MEYPEDRDGRVSINVFLLRVIRNNSHKTKFLLLPLAEIYKIG